MSAPTLLVHAPACRAAEFAWVCEVILGRWLGLSFSIEWQEQPTVSMHGAGGSVQWTDTFLAGADALWLRPETVPALPPKEWPLPNDVLRQATGQAGAVQFFGDGSFDIQPGRVHLPIDITGSAFFMLSRYEEAVAGAASDRHGRFPGEQSVVHRAGLTRRPIVDEWVELLWWALLQVQPGLQRRLRTPHVWVSCDVDAPYAPGGRSLPLMIRQLAGDLVHERSPRRAAKGLLHAVASRAGVTRFDPYDTFDWMQQVNERAGNRMTFYFLSVLKPEHIDGCYELNEPRVGALLANIVQRGHEVGLHGSYRSVDDTALLAGEFERLQAAVARNGGRQVGFGVRQHYLRWRMDGTAAALDALGFEHDSTLGYPDVPGFRCGTCHPYPLFDLNLRRSLGLLERPLVLMETTVLSPHYLGLGHTDEAMALMAGLRQTCRRFGGEFALLWHNSNFAHPRARSMYEALIQPLA